jgi:hypothetical protein
MINRPWAVIRAVSFSQTNCSNGDDVEIDSALPFNAEHEMEIAAS